VRQTGAAQGVRPEPDPDPASAHNEPTRVLRPATGAPADRNPRLRSEPGILINFDDDDE
jgi:hypothetical protein